MTAKEAEEGLLPKEPLPPGECVLLAGVVELKAAPLDLESRPESKTADRGAREKARSVVDLLSPPDKRPKVGKG
ncbi:MAG: hypothetical protein ABSE84_23660 [Isosphaeraceae bacterium]